MSKPNDIENRFIASPYIIQDNPFEEYLLLSLTQFNSLLERIEKLENKLEHYVEKYETVYNPIITVTSMIEQPEYTITCTEDYAERIEKLEKRVFPFEGDEKKCPY